MDWWTMDAGMVYGSWRSPGHGIEVLSIQLDWHLGKFLPKWSEDVMEWRGQPRVCGWLVNGDKHMATREISDRDKLLNGVPICELLFWNSSLSKSQPWLYFFFFVYPDQNCDYMKFCRSPWDCFPSWKDVGIVLLPVEPRKLNVPDIAVGLLCRWCLPSYG